MCRLNDCDWIGGGSENYANINNYDKSKLEGRGDAAGGRLTSTVVRA